jgi:hypothetical protein
MGQLIHFEGLTNGFTLAAVATLTLASFAPNRSGEGNRHVFF